MIVRRQPVAYLVASALFIFALHWMNDARDRPQAACTPAWPARRSRSSSRGPTRRSSITCGSSLAIVAGFAVGVPLSRVPLTAVPQRTALSHAFGGAGGRSRRHRRVLPAGWREGPEHLTPFRMVALIAEIILGYLTFTGSLMAAGKLQEVKWIPQRPVTYPLQNVDQPRLFGVGAGAGAALTLHPDGAVGAAASSRRSSCWRCSFGVLLIIPIGGADMPTVIAILNSYAGLSAVAMGFVLDNKLLITAGALDGSSGLILAIIMCKAMNRSFTNVLFGAFGQVQQATAGGEEKVYKSETPEGAAQVLEQANLVVIIPGLRHGGRPGAAQGARALRSAEEARHHGEVRHPSGRRPDARAT